MLYSHIIGCVHCAYIAISPILSWDNGLLLKQAEKSLTDTSFNKKFLFFTTSADDEGAIPTSREFAALLKKRSPKGLEWRFDFMEKDDHLSVVHPTIYNALVWLHKGWRIWETTLESMTLQQVKEHYNTLSLRYGSQVLVPEGVLFNLGYSLQDHGNTSEAIEAFTYSIKLYPGEASGYTGLGEIYMESGKLELAKKSLEAACNIAAKNNDNMVLPTAKTLLEQVLKKIKQKAVK